MSSEAEIRIEFDLPVTMRDGTVLRANVYRPSGSGSWPTLLARTPYNKSDPHHQIWSGLDPVAAARRGFIVVVQDVRGRFASDGVWDPYSLEGQDGFDTIAWAAGLQGSNGRVGTFSGSYCANVQWLAALQRPPALAAMAPTMTWSEPLDGLLERGGAIELGLALRWALENGLDSLSRLPLPDSERERRLAAIVAAADRVIAKGYWDLPMRGIIGRIDPDLPDLGVVRALDEPGIAARARVAGKIGDLIVPTLQTGGWYDIFLQGTLDNFQEVSASGRDARLVVGPWSHQTFSDPIGEVSFGLLAARTGGRVNETGDWSRLQLDWFEQKLAPLGPKEDEPRVRIFVMGRNIWRDEASWPPARAIAVPWYLRSDGRLTRDLPDSEEPPSTYRYDPSNPAPTLGGNGVLWPGILSGPVEQVALERREDVLVFTSDPLEADLEVTGRVRAVLHADSSAPSTDWVARLCDVWPDGRSFNICDGIVRVEQGAADSSRKVLVDLWSTSNVFLRGHRLRVHITSSSFPRWDRNLNTGRQDVARYAVARQRLHHGSATPSFVELPTLPTRG